MREQLGLDKPWYQQYWIFVKNLVTGDEYGWPGLGFSFDTRVSGRDELFDRAPRTLFLVVGAAFIWLIIGVTIGIISAHQARLAASTGPRWASPCSASPPPSSGSA